MTYYTIHAAERAPVTYCETLLAAAVNFVNDLPFAHTVNAHHSNGDVLRVPMYQLDRELQAGIDAGYVTDYVTADGVREFILADD